MHRRSLLSLLIAMVTLVACAGLAEAKVKLPSIISDNMVLQQGRPVTIWGWAEPGEDIEVRLRREVKSSTKTETSTSAQGQIEQEIEVYRRAESMRVLVCKVKADESGRWQTVFGALQSGESDLSIDVIDSSGEKTTIKNILVGEVWLCSGQSNMEMPVVQCNNAKREIAEAEYPKIRFFQVKNVTADKPQENCEGRWVECSPATAGGCTAAGYFFGRELFKEMNVPVGLIQSDWGGTPAEAWTSREAMDAKPALKPLLAHWDKTAAQDKKQADSCNRPANLYNAMIAPVLPYTIRGAIWYQGESNASRAKEYQTLFPTMIADWRARFKQPDLPFGFVQIAPFQYTSWNNQNNPCWCAELWEAQLLTLKNTPHTGMAVTTDVGNLKNIHPKNKQAVGHRLALWALATVYGKDRVYSGPIYRSMTVEGDKIRLSFDHVGGGLASRDGKPLTHFTIAGADKQFQPATATIDGETVIVASEAVKEPAAVRFGWHETAMPNLMNREGLPASPFRTDEEKGATEGE